MNQNDYLGQRVIGTSMRRGSNSYSNDDYNNSERESPAGFFIRLLARIMDSTIPGIIGYGIVLVQPNYTGVIASVIFVICYYFLIIPIMISSEMRGSPGKLICGLAIERTTRKQVGFFRALVREILVSILGIFTIFIIFSRAKIALHDLILDTKVVRKPISKKLVFPAILLTVALVALNKELNSMVEKKKSALIGEIYSFSQEVSHSQPSTLTVMHQDLSLKNAKPITENAEENTKELEAPTPKEEISFMANLDDDELGYISSGSKTLVFKDYFVKVVDIHNQGLKKKLAPSNYELQVALYDRKLNVRERESLAKMHNIVEGSKSAMTTFSIQLVDPQKKCSSSNYRTAKIQMKKVAAGYSTIFTPLSLMEKKRLTIICPNFVDGTEILFKMQNTFYRKQGSEIEVNLRIKALINK